MKETLEKNEGNLISVDFNMSRESREEKDLIKKFVEVKKNDGWEIIDSSSECYKEAREFVYGKQPHPGANCYDAIMKKGEKIYFYELKTNYDKKSKGSTGWNRVTFNELKLAYRCSKDERYDHRFVIAWSPTRTEKLNFMEFQLSDFRQFFTGKQSLAFDINCVFDGDNVSPSNAATNEITSGKIISSSNQLPEELKFIGEIFN